MNQLNAYMAFEIVHDSVERAERARRARPPAQKQPRERRRASSGSHPLRRVLAVLRS
jgi:hypothetical protein